MKIIKNLLTIMVAVLFMVFVGAVVLQYMGKEPPGISMAISQVTSKAKAAANVATSKLSSAISNAVSQEIAQSNGDSKVSSSAGKKIISGGTSLVGTPAIPIAKKITSTPASGQSQASVTTPVATATLQSVWGDTGISGLTVYEYGKTLLNNTEKAAYVNIAAAVENVSPSVVISTILTPTQIKTVYEYYVFDHAEIFYLDGVGLSYTQWGSNSTYTITFDYKYKGNKNTILSMRQQMGKKALVMLEAANGKSTDLGKEKALHDSLIKQCSYDVTASQNPDAYPDSFSAYGAFVNNKAVCEGYAQAMKLLLSSVGIKSIYITGQANGGSHAWNLDEIGGKWSYLDATFDDPVYSNSSGQYISYNTVSYTYFNYTSNSDHVVGKFNSSDPFAQTSENYAIMPQVG